MYNMDRLFKKAASKGPVCIGLDTAMEYIPPLERRNASSVSEAVISFNRAIIDSTFDAAACYKVQIAYYEELGLNGLSAYAQTLKYIRAKGGLVIADIKRGDIADTAERYAKAHFEGEFEADFVTLSPYMGMDSIEPWLEYAASKGKGAFVLMRTSNRGRLDFQQLEVMPEGKPAEKKFLYRAVADKLSALAAEYKGKHGYGAFGAVVGCTESEEAAEIRKAYPNLFFLVPGYGAQGGSAEDAALLFRRGNGGVVNASRSILKAWKTETSNDDKSGMAEANLTNEFAGEAACRAVLAMRDAILGAVKK